MSTNKTSAPVLGFNHNLKFGSRVYHVQTEDSGLPHAHYITHLFVGGNVLASMKTNYNDKADAPDLAKLVRSLMEVLHADEFVASGVSLREGDRIVFIPPVAGG